MSTNQAPPASREELPPPALLLQLILGFMATHAVHVAAKLGIADLLKEGPRKVSELAEETEVNEQALYRVLRALASLGVMHEGEQKSFSLTPVGEFLRSDVPGTMRAMATFMGEGWHSQPWEQIMYSVRTGRPSVEKAYGMDIFPWFGQNPEAAAVFNDAMTSFSETVAPAVAETYDFSSIRKLVDVGGGHGFLLGTILKANPHLRGVLFDQQGVVEGSEQVLEELGVWDRCEVVSGNFFETVPEGGDAYIMKHIIHDWDDERALAILKNIHTAMPEGGKLLLVESVIPEGDVPDPGKLIDLEMLIFTGGLERTESEFRDLYARAGFNLTRVVRTRSPLAVVEGVRV